MEKETKANYDLVLADLEAKKLIIENAIAAIKSLQGTGGDLPAADQASSTGKQTQGHKHAPGHLASDTFFGMGIVQAVTKYLGIVKAKKSTPEIADALTKGGYTSTSENLTNTIYTILYRRQKTHGDIIRVGQDWGLKEWYPGAKLKAPKNGDKEAKD